jgi:hypothetical protein
MDSFHLERDRNSASSRGTINAIRFHQLSLIPTLFYRLIKLVSKDQNGYGATEKKKSRTMERENNSLLLQGERKGIITTIDV